jgi:hypothetical protein
MSLTRKALRPAKKSLKHAFNAALLAVLRLEDVLEIARLKSDLISFYQPVNSQELLALERVAIAQQAMLRAARLEAILLTTCIEATEPYDNCSLAVGFLRLARQSNGWSRFLRYQDAAECQYRRALEDFASLQALR